MFSRRLPADYSLNDLALLSSRLTLSGSPIVDLTVSNPTGIKLRLPRPELTVSPWSYDPDPAGSFQARQAVAGYYADRGTRVDPSDVVLVASTSEAYAHLFRLLGDPGDELLVPAPSYPLFGPLADLECVRLRPYPLIHDGRWWLDFERLEEALSPRSRAIIVVNPNNPTGSFLSLSESERIEEIAAERGLPLIADEVFGDFVLDAPDRRPTFAESNRGLTFVLSGLSKISGLPQMKLGWIVVAGDPALKQRALEGLHWIADTFLSIGSPVQQLLPGLLEHRHAFQPALMQRIRTNLGILEEKCSGGSALRLIRPDGGWSAILKFPRLRSEIDWCTLLLERGVRIHPGHYYDFADEPLGVVSLLPPEELFRAGADIIGKAVDG